MGTLGTIIIGLFVALVARFVRSNNDSMGIILTSIVGIGGAFVGRFLGQAIGIYSSNQAASAVGALLGAVVILALVKTEKFDRQIPD